jgi:hypothetical protein
MQDLHEHDILFFFGCHFASLHDTSVGIATGKEELSCLAFWTSIGVTSTAVRD